MVFLPIVQRELRVASRRKSTHRVRFWTTLAAVGVSYLFILGRQSSRGGGFNLGQTSFELLTWYTFGLALLAGVFLAADCISEEKREGTLGLLFLTDLRGYDVVLGKLMSVGLTALYGLVAVLPVTALPLLMGGVTGGEWARAALALVNTLFFSLATGMLVSTWSRRSTQAMGSTLGVLALLVIGPPVLGSLSIFAKLPIICSYAVLFSPFSAFQTGASAYTLHLKEFWISLAVSHLFAWLMLGVASWRLPYVWQDRPVRGRGATVFTKPVFVSKTARSFELRTRMLDIHPILWLGARNRTSVRYIWLAGLGCVATCGILPVIWGQQKVGIMVASFLMWIFSLLLKLYLAAQACAFFVEARRSGALELVMSTPLKRRDIIHGQWLALKREFLWPAIFFLALQLSLLILQSGNAFHQGRNVFVPGIASGFVSFVQDSRLAIVLWELVMGTYGAARWVADLVALAWLGMCLGLTVKKPGLALPMTVLFVMVIPGVLFCVPGLIPDLVIIFWARQKLLSTESWQTQRTA